VFAAAGLQKPIVLHIADPPPVCAGQPFVVQSPCGGTHTLKPEAPYALQTSEPMQFDAAGLQES
jgi:hypothetical protein